MIDDLSQPAWLTEDRHLLSVQSGRGGSARAMMLACVWHDPAHLVTPSVFSAKASDH